MGAVNKHSWLTFHIKTEISIRTEILRYNTGTELINFLVIIRMAMFKKMFLTLKYTKFGFSKFTGSESVHNKWFQKNRNLFFPP